MRNKNLLLLACVLVVLAFSPFVGIADISFAHIFDKESVDSMIFWQLRAPRVLLAFFVGGALALSGLLFQTLFRNSLMTPFTLGVSSGATLGAALAIRFELVAGLLGFSFVTLFGFAGAVLTVVLLLAFAGRIRSFGSESLLLLGVALSHFYTAVLFVLYYTGGVLQTHAIVRFTLGSLGVAGFAEVVPVIVAALGLVCTALYFSPELRLLGVSNENAYLKGVDTKKVTLALLVAVSVVIGTATSVAGPIGFVGLIIPHLLKRLFRQDAGALVMTSFLGGGLFLLLCDLLSRSFGTESEIPIGVVTAFLGGPFFVYLILRHKVHR